MCTVKELKDYLNTLPEDATVEVLKKIRGQYENYTEWSILEIDGSSDSCYFDDSTNILYLGED